MGNLISQSLGEIFMDFKVSVIIVAYNTENYIKDCLDSVFSQNLKDFEVIIVNNASTDGTATIIKNYIAEKQNVIFLQNDKNLGGAAAGNMGIKKARGKYVFIMDSDDIMPSDTLKTLYHCAKSHSSDIVIGRAKSMYCDTVRNFKFKLYSIPYCLTGTYKSLHECKELLISPFYWGRLYKTDLLRKNNIQMPENFIFADMYLNSKALKFAKNITVCEHLSYIWRRFGTNDSHISITSPKNQIKTFIDRLQSYYDLEQLFSDPADSELLNSLRIYNLLRLLILTKFTDKNPSFAKLYFEEMYKYLEKIPYNDIKDNIYITSRKKLICYLIKEKRFEEFVKFSNPKHELKSKATGKYAVIRKNMRPENVPKEFLRHIIRKPEYCLFTGVSKFFGFYKFSFSIGTSPKNNFRVLRALLLDQNGNELYLSKVYNSPNYKKSKKFSFYIPRDILDGITENTPYSINIDMLFNGNFSSAHLLKDGTAITINKHKNSLTLNSKTI